MHAKDKKKKLLIAIIVAIVATLSVFNFMKSQKSAMQSQGDMILALKKQMIEQARNLKSAQEREKKFKVVVVKEDIMIGDVIKLEVLEIKEFDEKELPEKYFKNTRLIIGKIATQNLKTGKLLEPEDVVSDAVNKVEIPYGMRVITIPSTFFQGLASYIYIGAKVDLLSVSTPPKFIAQNIKIVSFESPIVKRRATTSVLGGNTQKAISSENSSGVTLLIPVDLVKDVVNAMVTGKLQIITRNKKDNNIVYTKTLPPPPSQAFSLKEAPIKKSSLPEPTLPSSKPKTIEVIVGSAKETVTFKNNTSEYLYMNVFSEKVKTKLKDSGS